MVYFLFNCLSTLTCDAVINDLFINLVYEIARKSKIFKRRVSVSKSLPQSYYNTSIIISLTKKNMGVT